MAKKPKNEFASPDPFSLAVCNRIRWCIGQRARVVAERAEAFKARDALKSQLGQLILGQLKGTSSEDDVRDAKARAFDAERRIEELQHDIGFYTKAITDTVVDADKPMLDGLFDEMPTPVPLPPPGVVEPKPAKEEKSAGQKFRENLDRKNRDLTPVQVGPVVEGVAEHMNASVNELDLPELQKGRLVKAGLDTVLKFAVLVDSMGFTPTGLEEVCSCSERHAAQMLGALEKYRKVHRKAAAAAEREAVVHG